MSRFSIFVLACSLAGLLPLVSAHAAAQQRPNIVLIVTDDVGYGDLGSYGAPDIKTPHIDSLAREGIRLTDFYANGATCTPTRVGLITGRYQQRYALERPLGAGSDRELGLAASSHSMPQLLQRNGYATALVGKWHLGWTPAFSPQAHGFDYFFGFKSGYVDYYRHTSGDGQHDLFENDQPVHVPGYMTDLITQRSVQFIKQNAQRPFFIDVSYSATHWPFQPPDKPSTAHRHRGPLDETAGTRADYAAMLERADEGVGRILQTLDELGLKKNTLVIFTNDNGGEWLSRNTPLFHHKGTVWEGGIRVPTLLRWPERIPAGRVSAQVGMSMDLTASILAASGTPAPQAARLEGIDLLPVFEGRAEEIKRTLFWRVGGDRPQQAVRAGDWKLIFDGWRPLLFNLQKDMSERDNLIGQHPEIARRLEPLLTAWQAEVDAEARRRELPLPVGE